MKTFKLIHIAVAAIAAFFIASSAQSATTRDSNRRLEAVAAWLYPVAENAYAIPVEYEFKPVSRVDVVQFPAPSASIALKYDELGWAFVATTTAMTLSNVLGTGVNLDVLGFAGARLESGAIVGGGAVVYPFRVADGVQGFIGPGLEFADGDKPKWSLVIGARF